MTSKRLAIINSYLIQKLDAGLGPAYDSDQFEALVGAVRLVEQDDDGCEVLMLGRLALAALGDHLRSSVNAERLIDKAAYQIGDHPG